MHNNWMHFSYLKLKLMDWARGHTVYLICAKNRFISPLWYRSFLSLGLLCVLCLLSPIFLSRALSSSSDSWHPTPLACTLHSTWRSVSVCFNFQHFWNSRWQDGQLHQTWYINLLWLKPTIHTGKQEFWKWSSHPAQELKSNFSSLILDTCFSTFWQLFRDLSEFSVLGIEVILQTAVWWQQAEVITKLTPLFR